VRHQAHAPKCLAGYVRKSSYLQFVVICSVQHRWRAPHFYL
jgi:hypothetical protein